MSAEEEIIWRNLLGFSEEQIQDIRFTGYFYIRQGKYEMARSFFEALVIFQSQEAPARRDLYDFKTLGALYLELGRYRRSLRYLEKALTLNPDDPSVLLNRLYCLFSLDRVEEGILAAKQLQICGLQHIEDAANALVLAWKGNDDNDVNAYST